MHELVSVYTICPIDKKTTNTIHHNMFMRVNELPIHTLWQVPVSDHQPSPSQRQKCRLRRPAQAADVVSEPVDVFDSSLDKLGQSFYRKTFLSTDCASLAVGMNCWYKPVRLVRARNILGCCWYESFRLVRARNVPGVFRGV